MSPHTSHLGDIAAALVDGELGVDARERALAHVVGCDRCRADIEVQRRLKARLHRLATTDRPVGDLQLLLGSVPALSSALAPLDATQAAANPVGSAGLAGPAGYPRRMVFVGLAACVVAGLAGAFELGGARAAPSGPVVSPAVASYAVEDAATTGEVALTDTTVGTVAVSFRP